jgi:hypothetical protein
MYYFVDVNKEERYEGAVACRKTKGIDEYVKCMGHVGSPQLAVALHGNGHLCNAPFAEVQSSAE